MLQEGLKLLLQDLQCDVTIIRNNIDLQFYTTDTDCPQLIISSIALKGSSSSEQLINQLRTHYKTDVPVILLDYRHDFEVINNNKINNIYFSDGSNPKQLKKNITKLLHKVKTP